MTADLLRVLLFAALVSSMAMLLVLTLRKPMRVRFGASAAYALWALVPLSAGVALLPAPATTMSMQVVPLAVTDFVTAAPSVVMSEAKGFDPSAWLAAAWLLGTVVAFTVFAWQQRRFVRGLGRLSAAGDRTMRAQTTAGCPALLGAWRPRVVVPADFEQRYSVAERELILVHERTHRARGDAQINAFVAALRCAFWFNPLVHFAASRFRFDQELACDAAVIARFPDARRAYADAMLKAQLAGFGLPVGCNWQSSHPLKERIALLKQPLPGRARAMLGAAVAVTLVVGGTYVAWAQQSPGSLDSRSMVDLKNKSMDIPDRKATYRRLSRITYPENLIEAKVEGVVYVKAHVDATGNVLTAAVDRIDPATATALGDVAVEGVRNWSFEPAQKNGRAVASDEIVPVVFTLDPEAKPKIIGATLGPVRVSRPKPLSYVTPPSPTQPHRIGSERSVAAIVNPARARAGTGSAEALPAEPRPAPSDNNRVSSPPTPVVRTAGSVAVDSTAAKNVLTQTGTSRVFVPPKVTHHWRPPYPQDAYQAHEEGEAEVLVTISADGSLKDAHINRSSGSESLDQASLDAVRRYTYSAAQKGGTPIEAQANVALEWTISPPLEFTVASGMTAKREASPRLSTSR